MSTATYVAKDLATKGDWIGVYGTAGRLLPLSPSDSAVLPAWLSSAALVQGSRYDYVTGGGTPQATVDADGRALATGNPSPPPARSARIWYQAAGGVILSAVPTGSSPYRISAYLVDWDNQRTGCTASVLDAEAADAVLDSRSLTQAEYRAGGYLTWTCTGPVKIKVVQGGGTNAVVFGLFFDNAHASYEDPGLGGIALGGDWPPSLAIALAAPGGIALGVGEGMDPSQTRVEDGLGGIALGGEWPASAAFAEEAFAGIALGGHWTAASASDPTTLRAAIYSRLKASTPLAAVVGPRIHHGRAPQRSAWPAVVFHAPARSYGHNLGGGDGTSSATVQIDCWGTSPDQCEAAATAVRLAFQGFRGTIGQVEFLGCFLEDLGETIERDSPGSDEWTYRTILTLEARHRVSIPTPED